MATKTITWPDGSTAVLTYGGQGSGTITVQSDPNNHYEARSAQIIVKTTDGSNIQRTVTIQQAAKVRIDISTALVTASAQTYSGSALTPDVHVILNGVIVDGSGYDVAYSDNINAGTATITVTGKGDYAGTAYGTFTINQATGQVTTVPTARSVTYNGNTQYLITAGAGTGTMYYRYKLSTSSTWSSWSSTRARATDAGTYDVQYVAYASSDGNYTTSAVGSLSVTMAKASRTLSFAVTYAVVAPSGTVTKIATPSAGSGDGAITYTISSTTYATINSSTGAITAKTSDGSAVVTATIAEGTNYLSATASYNLYVFATTHNYDYNGSYRNVTLPPGTYQFQCWGAQGGSNAADSTHGITAKAGGKGGYSIGQLTIAQETAVKVNVGGQGSSSAGGFNGGGSTTGSSTYNSGGEEGVSCMGGGGGATDIRLSDGALLSRMIVAGGGSGGAMCYKKVTTTNTLSLSASDITSSGMGVVSRKWVTATTSNDVYYVNVSSYRGGSFTIKAGSGGGAFGFTTNTPELNATVQPASDSTNWDSRYFPNGIGNNGTKTGVVPSDAVYMVLYIMQNGTNVKPTSANVSITTTTTTNESQVGYVGGGTSGGGYSDTYKGRQNAAGNNGAFGQGANQTTLYSRYASGAGGAGWYGGGIYYGDGDINHVHKSGGGSGFVNTAASAGNRPSGYTGLQLDSGETKAGNTTFPSTSGGTETGHSGNGYARITRLS